MLQQQQRGIAHSAASSLAQGKAPSEGAAAASTSDSSTKQDSSPGIAKLEWTEIVDEKTGGIYYWNQSTGGRHGTQPAGYATPRRPAPRAAAKARSASPHQVSPRRTIPGSTSRRVSHQAAPSARAAAHT